MEADSDLQAAKARTEQAIGRNVLLFQRLKRLLKFVVDHGRIEADQDHLLQKKQRPQTAEASKSTLGVLVGNFIDDILRRAATDGQSREEPRDQRPRKAASIECVKEMRRDAAFAETTFEFRLVQF